VASYGADANPGTREAPVATVQQALANLKAAYASDAGWPEKGTEFESSGGIVILGPEPVEVAQMITINNNGSAYPSIVLCDDTLKPGGKLQATAAIESGNWLLRLQNNANVTLEGGLVLAGTGNADDTIGGVYVYGSTCTFTMNGGEISDTSFSSITTGGGVYSTGTFIMNGGVISGNSGGNGGGVYSTGTFTMNGGEISGNSSSGGNGDGNGGGVYSTGTFTMYNGKISDNSSSGGGGVLSVGTFTMTGGEISGNFGADAGGGVALTGSAGTFTMTGGVISGNSISSDNYLNGGGGVWMIQGTFIMSGGEISGNSSHSYGGGLAINASYSVSLVKTGGVIYGYDGADPDNSNVVKNPSSGASVADRGHAVFVKISPFGFSSSYLKETTLGPADDLTYNYPNEGEHSGW
jgi:hypothetical protein